MISDVQRMLKPGAICEGMNMKITSIYDDTGAKKKKVQLKDASGPLLSQFAAI